MFQARQSGSSSTRLLGSMSGCIHLAQILNEQLHITPAVQNVFTFDVQVEVRFIPRDVVDIPYTILPSAHSFQ